MATEYNLAPAKAHLDRLLDTRDHPKTICPSEAARALSAGELRETGASSWRDLMPALRILAFELRDQGKIEIMQKGTVLSTEQSLERISGPIRLRRVTDGR